MDDRPDKYPARPRERARRAANNESGEAESRISRLKRRQESRKEFAILNPRLDSRTETRSLVIFGVVLTALSAALAAALLTGIPGPDSNGRAVLSLALGLMAASALASGLTFLIRLRHLLLALVPAAAFAAAAAAALGLTPLESLAKIVFACAAGLWISLMLTSISQVLLIAVLIIAVDFYSVFFGPTKKMVESSGPWIDYLTVSLPVIAVDATSRLGIADFIFFSIFIGCALTFRLRRVLTSLAMAVSFVATMMIGVSLDIGVPALPLLSIFFVAVNADLLYRRFLQEPDSGKRDEKPEKNNR